MHGDPTWPVRDSLSAHETRRVLVVDDDTPVRLLLRVNLVLSGFDVIEAADGAAALLHAKADAPDLILLDARLPVIDGLSVLEELGRDAVTASIPVIGVTAMVEPGVISGFFGGGVVDVITKPFDPAALVAKVVAALAA